ncbi:MAG: PhoH family protein, partial [Rubrivivax sp.]|nr:PhoH family protein [Rubrivivax sp.]
MIRRHRFEAADNRRLAHLCGPLDAHLRQVEAALGVRLTRRDAEFRIEGPRAAVARTADLLDELYRQAQRPLAGEQLQLALAQAMTAAGPGPTGGAGAGPRVERASTAAAAPTLHTRHAGLAGRTPNQVQYLQQILAHDITFGIGPAGTG